MYVKKSYYLHFTLPLYCSSRCDTEFELKFDISKSLVSEPKLGSPFATELNLKEISQLADISDNAIFLGQKNGKHYVGLDVSSVDEGEVNEILPKDSSFRDLREVGAILDRFDSCVLAYCRAMFYWHQNNKFCGACGGKTFICKAGHQIDCIEVNCRKPAFPRTDPAVIMLVYDLSLIHI